MIRRDTSEGFMLIAQDEHARAAGVLAEHLTYHFRAELRYRTEFIAAVAGHDAGWIDADEQGHLNASAAPMHVFETPVNLSLQIWTRSVQLARSLHPYSALLISMHQMALSNVVLGHPHHTPADIFGINKFQHQQAEVQEKLRMALGMRTDIPLNYGVAARGIDIREDLLRDHFRLLTFCDRVSLELCCGRTLFSTIQEIPLSSNEHPVTIQTHIPDAARVLLSPWPFAIVPAYLKLEVIYRMLSDRTYPSPDDCRNAWQNAAAHLIQFQLQGSR